MSVKHKWLIALGLGWLGFMGAGTAQDLIPTSYWFEVGELSVENNEQGVCPVLHFTREINRPFSAEWLVTLRRQTEAGFEFYKLYPDDPPGMADYRSDAVLPSPLTFDWWAWIDSDECDWPVGVYQVLTEWKVDIGHRTRIVRVESNPFHVTPSEKGN